MVCSRFSEIIRAFFWGVGRGDMAGRGNFSGNNGVNTTRRTSHVRAPSVDILPTTRPCCREKGSSGRS